MITLVSDTKIKAFCRVQGVPTTPEGILRGTKEAIKNKKRLETGVTYLIELYAGLREPVLQGQKTRVRRRCPVCNSLMFQVAAGRQTQLICDCETRSTIVEPELLNDSWEYQKGRLEDWLSFQF